MRIVSLLPAATEIVWALGLGDELVGVSHACDYPPQVVGRPVVSRPAPAPEDVPAVPGRTEVDHALLATLRADLVLAPPGRMLRGTAVAELAALRDAAGADAAIVTLDPTSLEGLFHAIATIGAMTEAEDEAVGFVEILRERLADVEEVVEGRREQGHAPPRVVTLEWLEPPMTAGLWIPEQVRRAGGWELIGSDGRPSVSTTWLDVIDLEPEMILLAPWGLDLALAARAWAAAPRPAALAELPALRREHVFALDASAYFSRPGPRLIDGIELLAEIFDPAAFVDTAPAGSWVPVQ